MLILPLTIFRRDLLLLFLLFLQSEEERGRSLSEMCGMYVKWRQEMFEHSDGGWVALSLSISIVRLRTDPCICREI